MKTLLRPSMKRILMIAYHFPPLHGSSGVQRTLKFAKFLPEFGWQPTVLTAHPLAYEQTSGEQLSDIPAGVRVCRAPALDSARHLAVMGRYPRWLARPDRWKSWWLGAVPAGLKLIRQTAPHVLWSTYPIATAHSIGATLQKLSRLPWVADFRDPMAQPGYPRDAKTWQQFKRIEERAVSRATRLVFATPGAQRMYRERYGSAPAERFDLIENGFDEESFTALADNARDPLNPGKLTLLHSGIVYPKERDPSHLFEALRVLLDRGTISADRLRVRFRAAVHEDLIASMAQQAGVASLVEILPAIGYSQALQEMQSADALLVLQAANCSEQIPAKMYEYFRCGRPVLGLTSLDGDTANALRDAGYPLIAPLDDAACIAELLAVYVSGPQHAAASIPGRDSVMQHSRRNRAAELAKLLDALT